MLSLVLMCWWTDVSEVIGFLRSEVKMFVRYLLRFRSHDETKFCFDVILRPLEGMTRSEQTCRPNTRSHMHARTQTHSGQRKCSQCRKSYLIKQYAPKILSFSVNLNFWCSVMYCHVIINNKLCSCCCFTKLCQDYQNSFHCNMFLIP